MSVSFVLGVSQFPLSFPVPQASCSRLSCPVSKPRVLVHSQMHLVPCIPQKAPGVILFDVMSTLVTDPFTKVIPRVFNMSMNEFYKEAHPDTWYKFEKGHLEEEEFSKYYFKDQRKFDLQRLKSEVHSLYEFIPNMENLLNDLSQASIPMHIASNYPEWYSMIEDKLSLSRYLPWSYVSCHLGVRKPDRDFFAHIAQDLNISLNDILLVDDDLANIQSASQYGMQVFHFKPSHPSSTSAPTLISSPVHNTHARTNTYTSTSTIEHSPSHEQKSDRDHHSCTLSSHHDGKGHTHPSDKSGVKDVENKRSSNTCTSCESDARDALTRNTHDMYSSQQNTIPSGGPAELRAFLQTAFPQRLKQHY
eukprot:TRINITY_DN4527_c0_g1::TRINITY_DN4527_c0_g1_i1::g.23191::m.23191 TRINITY_DN4527_c0_g1::TRINITY_DN4527_c0_g1_i1::g.23191  ORF type:complete len:362 (-),score=23.29,sp/Q84VZ1/FHY1C_ARATH/40.33/2e-43,HAD_2/PF13419.1/1.8e-18,Hydrolase_like/PF13242.1/0.00025,Acid_PPase/PF12689.2/0.0041,Dehyd-heme_bind/PF09098.5/0.085,OrfB_Zn_ribbon/PF07282.6/1.9e+02,OrfB_Zn_ribbon/PF07282.6/5.5 TRINITY_DN4527_c0_g1_i1:255-1340(-)